MHINIFEEKKGHKIGVEIDEHIEVYCTIFSLFRENQLL